MPKQKTQIEMFAPTEMSKMSADVIDDMKDAFGILPEIGSPDKKELSMQEKYSELIEIYVEFRDIHLKAKITQAYAQGYINDLKTFMSDIDINGSHLDHIIAQVGKDIERSLDINQWGESTLPYRTTMVDCNNPSLKNEAYHLRQKTLMKAAA